MAGAKIPLTFRIYKGEQLLREETLTQPVIKVGKLSSSHLRLDDDSVSRMHAVIEVTGPGDISIIDLGSTKGTIVNGQKVNKAKLQHGDAIQLGDLKIELTIEEDELEDEPTRVNVAAANEVPAAESNPVIASVPHPTAAPAPVAPAPVAAPAPAPAPAAAAAPPPGIAPPPGLGGAAPAPAPAVSAPPAFATQPPQFGTDAIDDVGGARAIEVVAMLEDAVEHVKHVTNPRGGKVTTTTYAMFGLAAVMLVLSAIGFGTGVSNAAHNKEALHEWTEVQRKPVFDFRPRRISPVFGAMALGGLGFGLLFFTVGLVRFRNEKVSPFFRIGTEPEVEFPTTDSPAPSFPIVAPMGDDFVFNYSPGWEGEMTLEGTSTPLAELQGSGKATPSATAPGAMQVQIPLKARFRVSTGNSTYLVSSVPAARKHPVPLFAIETSVLAYFGGTAVVMLSFLGLLFLRQPPLSTMNFDWMSGDDGLTRLEATPPEDPLQEEEIAEDSGDDQAGGTGTKMALDEGKMGKKDSSRQSGQYAMKKNHEGDPQLARQQAMENARTAGVLGALSSAPGGAFASITGAGDFSSGLDDRDVYGGLMGNEVGEMQGGWGYGLKGTGPGGGGTGWGTIGTGRYGTIGHGSGTGSGYGVGSGKGGMRGRRPRPPQVNIGNATATGDLDKNIIRRYIRKKLPQIKYCYEKQLLVKPSLAGTVTTVFTISGNGAVISMAASGMGSKEVENCVGAAVKGIQFPKPKGGGLVNVRYPFTFRPGAQ